MALALIKRKYIFPIATHQSPLRAHRRFDPVVADFGTGLHDEIAGLFGIGALGRPIDAACVDFDRQDVGADGVDLAGFEAVGGAIVLSLDVGHATAAEEGDA